MAAGDPATTLGIPIGTVNAYRPVGGGANWGEDRAAWRACRGRARTAGRHGPSSARGSRPPPRATGACGSHAARIARINDQFLQTHPNATDDEVCDNAASHHNPATRKRLRSAASSTCSKSSGPRSPLTLPKAHLRDKRRRRAGPPARASMGGRRAMTTLSEAQLGQIAGRDPRHAIARRRSCRRLPRPVLPPSRPRLTPIATQADFKDAGIGLIDFTNDFLNPTSGCTTRRSLSASEARARSG